jgi:hypothetical protein
MGLAESEEIFVTAGTLILRPLAGRVLFIFFLGTALRPLAQLI